MIMASIALPVDTVVQDNGMFIILYFHSYQRIIPSFVTEGDAGFQGGPSGYGPQVDWAGPAFNQYRPAFNMYGNPGAVPFDTSAYPVMPFQMPSYVPPFYPGMSDP